MTEGALYQPKRASPTALTLVVLLHGAAITALALSKIEFQREEPTRTHVIDIKNPPPPPDVPPPEPVKSVQPPVSPPLYVPPRIIDPPIQRPAIDVAIDLPPPTPPIYVPRVEPKPVPPPPPPPPQKSRSARAKANLASYVSNSDYPAAAIRAGDQGITRFRLAVGANGRVSDCAVTASSGSSALDSATCRLMRSRARFTPARDSSGNATTDTVTSAIHWVLPD